MRVGLVGSTLSADLGVLKREIEDRGHKAAIFNPRKAPEYALAAIGTCGATATLAFDHRNLVDFDSLYIGDLEGRDRFFRGYFEKDIWMSLRQRYLNFAAAEVDALAFQLSLVLLAADRVPTVNSPASIVATRLRPSVLWKARRAGIPVWPFEIREGAALGAIPGVDSGAVPGAAPSAAPGGQSETTPSAAPLAMRMRAVEEARIDVPCFPREMKHTLSLVAEAPRVAWRMIAVAGARTGKMIVTEAGKKRVAAAPAEAAVLGDRLLDLFGLAVAEVDLAPEGPSTRSSPAEGPSAGGSSQQGPLRQGSPRDGSPLRVLDVSPFPRLAEFEEITGERSGALVAETLLRRETLPRHETLPRPGGRD